jgi:hypothetical protein
MNFVSKAAVFLGLVFVLTSISSSPAMAGDEDFSEQTEAVSQRQGGGFNPGTWFISFYKKHISPVNGDQCPSYPTCSTYAAQAFKKHGFFIGWMMAVDRLIHEGSEETSVSPFVYSDGKTKIYDPVENNDFWWFSKSRDHEE